MRWGELGRIGGIGIRFEVSLVMIGRWDLR